MCVLKEGEVMEMAISKKKSCCLVVLSLCLLVIDDDDALLRWKNGKMLKIIFCDGETKFGKNWKKIRSTFFFRFN